MIYQWVEKLYFLVFLFITLHSSEIVLLKFRILLDRSKVVKVVIRKMISWKIYIPLIKPLYLSDCGCVMPCTQLTSYLVISNSVCLWWTLFIFVLYWTVPSERTTISLVNSAHFFWKWLKFFLHISIYFVYRC